MRPVSPHTQIISAFRWFGLGSLLLAVVLFGSVGADSLVQTPRWQTLMLSLGTTGVIFIVAGMLILLMNVHRLQKGENV